MRVEGRMKIHNRRYLIYAAVVLLILVLTMALEVKLQNKYTSSGKREAENILQFYSENMMLQLKGSLNEADSLAQAARIMHGSDPSWFKTAAAPLLEKEEVRYVCLIEGDIISAALPESEFSGQDGQNLKDFSYIYTLAKVVKDIVVEGPVELDSAAGTREVFLFLQPYLEDDAYMGEVVVALDNNYVLQELGLDYLVSQGYEYELWRVGPQNGSKEVIAVSQEGIDFSHAAKSSFYLPTQWNLSIQPAAGWVSPAQRTGILLFCGLSAALVLGLVFCLFKLTRQRRMLKQVACRDIPTGLFNYAGFTDSLDAWLSQGDSSIQLFYLVFEGYTQMAQQMGHDQETAFLQSIRRRLREYIQNPFIAGRLDSGIFILAIREDMTEVQQEDFAKGLSLEPMLKIRLKNEKSFLTARYQYMRCQPGTRAADAVSAVIDAYYTKSSKESPVYMLTQKCRQLIEGKSNVVFDEYTDPGMMELSKTFNQYRKQVEQLAYSDPVFSVGNRPKYLRDTNMLISYDKKRRFGLFCVDICSFSQYNELFSADIGDAILQEVVNRLSRLLGTYLYRINGDVFLGISLSDEPDKSFAKRLQQLLTSPVTAGNASFALQVRIAVCQYPAHGSSPEVLLDRIQSALRFSKESGQKIVIYNNKLNQAIRIEADILRRLKSSIHNKTLEVWYQPLSNLSADSYTALEALVRLPDGKGGYHSAALVIFLAERSGMVELLGDYVLKRACCFMHSHGKELGLERICINLSVQQLLVENSADHLLRLIQESGVATSQVTLEITESILIQSIERASATLDTLRRAGLHIALDDFGVGYSSLNYLPNMPVDVIKIDRSLTQQILTNPKQHALLKSIVEMAKINSLSVVAEGVETEEEQKMISASGVQYIQGYYYARPMPEKELISFFNEIEKNTK